MPKKGQKIIFTSLGAMLLNHRCEGINYVTLDEISKLFKSAVGQKEQQTAFIFKGFADCLTFHRSGNEKPVIKLPYDGVVQLKRDDAIAGLIFLQYTKKDKSSLFVLMLSDPSTVTALEELIHNKNKSAILWSQTYED
uniref:DUF5733 domain-containing protein n=1 Tax=Schistocephalus solidus TaxID=70667 RepID=A0A0X3NST2_SCHSO